MRSMVVGVECELRPLTAIAAKPAQAARAWLQWAVPLPRCAREDKWRLSSEAPAQSQS
jgi:hypothetical protein